MSTVSQNLYIPPVVSITKVRGGLSQARRLSKLVCEGRRESHRQKGTVRGGWGLNRREFRRGTPSFYTLIRMC